MGSAIARGDGVLSDVGVVGLVGDSAGDVVLCVVGGAGTCLSVGTTFSGERSGAVVVDPGCCIDPTSCAAPRAANFFFSSSTGFALATTFRAAGDGLAAETKILICLLVLVFCFCYLFFFGILII